MINKQQTNFSNASNEEEITRKTNLSLNLRFEAYVSDDEESGVCPDPSEVDWALYHSLAEKFIGKLDLQNVVEAISTDADQVFPEDLEDFWVLEAKIDFHKDITETDAIRVSELISHEFLSLRGPDVNLIVEQGMVYLKRVGCEALLYTYNRDS